MSKLQRAALTLMTLLLCGLGAPAGALAGGGGPEFCVVSREEMEMVMMRRKPNSWDVVEKRVYAGECGLFVTGDCRGRFCPVRQGRFTGWIPARNLAPVSPPVLCVARVVRGDVLELRAMPSNSARLVARVDRHYCGITLLTRRVGHWRLIRADGYEGWVSFTNLRLP